MAFHTRHTLCVLLLVAIATATADTAHTAHTPAITIHSLDRTIDCASQLVKINVKVTTSFDKDDNNGLFTVLLTDAEVAALVNIEAEEKANKLTLTKINGGYTISLGAVTRGARRVFTIAYALSHSLTPAPATITQFQNQKLIYRGNHYFFTPYFVETQTTQVVVPSNPKPKIEARSDKSPSHVSDATVHYGPYTKVAPKSVDPLFVHFVANTPLLTVTKLVRELEISHWGNLAVEEHYDDLVNQGAALSGSFSRFDYQMNPQGTPTAVPDITSILPAGATDFYYRDETGNISTSSYIVRKESVDLIMVHRFPLLGGWKTAFYYGYNLPLSKYLSRSGENYRLMMGFAPVIGDVVVDELILKIILPEGAKNIRVTADLPFERMADENRKTYLDTTGRTVVVLTKKNVAGKPFNLKLNYEFGTFAIFREPLLLFGGFLAIFIFFIAVSRIKIRIGTKTSEEATSSKLLVRNFVAKANKINEDHEALDGLAAKSKKDKSVSFGDAKQKCFNGIRAMLDEMNSISGHIKSYDASLPTLCQLFVRKEEERMKLQESLLASEMKGADEKKLATLEKQYAELCATIDEIVDEIDE